MRLESINFEQRVYVTGRYDVGFSCYGFDVLDRKARGVQSWIESETDSADDRQAVRLWLDNVPALGAVEHFEHCAAMMARGAEFNRRTGKRCGIELCRSLIGLEGFRVECDYYGERIRFTVGKSTGWMPAHLLIHSARSAAGEALSPDAVKNVRVVRR